MVSPAAIAARSAVAPGSSIRHVAPFMLSRRLLCCAPVASTSGSPAPHVSVPRWYSAKNQRRGEKKERKEGRKEEESERKRERKKERGSTC